MGCKTGKSKSSEQITLADALQYPIWESATDEEGIKGQDETWERPVIDTDNVTEDIFCPRITLELKGSDIYGSGEYDYETDGITEIAIWVENEWIMLSDTNLSVPVTFVSIPKINSVENVEFSCDDLEDEEAFRD